MSKLITIKFVAFVLCAFSLPVFGQSNRKIEQELVKHIKNIQKWSNYGNNRNTDLLEKENDVFKIKLLKYIKKPSTLKYQFNDLRKHLFISTSEDGMFRIYSWDTESGGTAHFYETVYQFQGKNGKVNSKSYDLTEGDNGSFVSDVFQLNTKAGMVYLARFTSILSTSAAYQSINLFKIENNSLNDKIRLLKTDTGIENSLGFEYDFFSVVDRKERPIKLILYDKSTKSIKIPIVVKDETFQYGKVTDKFITYKFNGTYFVNVD